MSFLYKLSLTSPPCGRALHWQLINPRVHSKNHFHGGENPVFWYFSSKWFGFWLHIVVSFLFNIIILLIAGGTYSIFLHFNHPSLFLPLKVVFRVALNLTSVENNRSQRFYLSYTQWTACQQFSFIMDCNSVWFITAAMSGYTVVVSRRLPPSKATARLKPIKTFFLWYK